jgi:hypothetical protein
MLVPPATPPSPTPAPTPSLASAYGAVLEPRQTNYFNYYSDCVGVHDNSGKRNRRLTMADRTTMTRSSAQASLATATTTCSTPATTARPHRVSAPMASRTSTASLATLLPDPVPAISASPAVRALLLHPELPDGEKHG